jgi:hypothetical protein
MSFDPYYEWLGIPPDEQPADHYRLLGVRRFETNAKVIENGAERQLLLLKTFQNGPHGPLTQQIMNEVAAARVCLLDDQKRARYDAELASRSPAPPPRRTPASAPPAPADSGEHAGFALQPPATAPARPSTRPAPVSQQRGTQNLAWASLGFQVAIGGLAAVCVVVVVLWIFWGRDPFGVWQRGADQRDVADAQDAPQRQPKRRPAARPHRPFGQQPARPFAGPPRPPKRGVSDPRQQRMHQVDPEPNSPFREIDSSALQQPDVPRDDVESMIRPNRGTIGPAASDAADPPPVPPAPPEPTDPFSGLRTAVDMVEDASAANSPVLSLGDIPATVAARCQIQLEDFGAPLSDARFELSRSETGQDAPRWTLLAKLPLVDASSATDTEQQGDHGVANRTLAHLEASEASLALQFIDVPDAAIIQQLAVCSLIFEDGEHRHTIQLSIPHRMSPLEVSFSDAKQEVMLDNPTALAQVATDRLALEVIGVTVGQDAAPANLVAPPNEELLVTLDAELEMKLGLRLAEADRQYRLVLMPRTTVSGRRQPLVRLDLEKDLAREKAQLARSRRDLVAANNQLRSLPAEIRRVSAMRPGTPQEASMRQGRLNQLEKIGKSLQSKVRRLAEADPKLSQSIAQLEQVLQTLSELAGQTTVQFRVYAKGNAGEYELIRATADVLGAVSTVREAGRSTR